ncbi:unnamed protein product, partial [marine sediment metagenome]
CIPYHGNPFIAVEWIDRQASQDKEFKGYSYKVFSQQDKEALDFDPKDLVVECQANWDGLDKPLVGLGVTYIMLYPIKVLAYYPNTVIVAIDSSNKFAILPSLNHRLSCFHVSAYTKLHFSVTSFLLGCGGRNRTHMLGLWGR